MKSIESRLEQLEHSPETDQAALILKKVRSMSPDERTKRRAELEAKLFAVDLSKEPPGRAEKIQALRKKILQTKSNLGGQK
jgi:ribosomal protein L29